MTTRIDDARRAAIVAAITSPTRPSRAQIARDHGVDPRTVQRLAEQHGIVDPWDTSGTAAATRSAGDRRRHLRSQLADELLTVEVPRLRARMAGPWRRTAVLLGPDGPETVQVTEDDATIARGLKDLHTAVGIAVDKTLVVDRQDSDAGTDDAVSMLGKLAAGLEGAYRALNAPHADEQ